MKTDLLVVGLLFLAISAACAVWLGKRRPRRPSLRSVDGRTARGIPARSKAAEFLAEAIAVFGLLLGISCMLLIASLPAVDDRADNLPVVSAAKQSR